MQSIDTRQNSRRILDGRDRAPARSYLKGMGFTEEDLNKPIVGVAHSWIETMPCNFNHRHLAEKVKEGVRAAGGTPMELNTVAISDGITMGTQGMKTSLVSREIVADSIELVGRGHMFDAIVTLVGCDKTIPGGAMALAMQREVGSLELGKYADLLVTNGDPLEVKTDRYPALLKFPGRFGILEANEAVLPVTVPYLAVQPLVENAVTLLPAASLNVTVNRACLSWQATSRTATRVASGAMSLNATMAVTGTS